MKTKQTEKPASLSSLIHLAGRVDKLEEHANQVNQRLEAVKPIKGQPHGAAIEVDMQTKKQMAIEAQALGLRSAEELTQVVLHAFIDLCEEDNGITFPLMLQKRV